MGGTNANVMNWVGAVVYTAPLGTDVPTDLDSDWADGWLPVGFIDQDQGIELTPTWTSTQHREYSGAVVATTTKDENHTIKWTSLEENLTVLGLVNPGGSASTTDGVTTVHYGLHVPNPRLFGLDLNNGSVIDRWFGQGDVTDPSGVLKKIKDGIDMFEITATLEAIDAFWATRLTNAPGLAS